MILNQHYNKKDILFVFILYLLIEHTISKQTLHADKTIATKIITAANEIMFWSRLTGLFVSRNIQKPKYRQYFHEISRRNWHREWTFG